MREFTSADIACLDEIIKARRDVRGNRFLDKKIDDETLDKLLQAACDAPSVGFSQPWKFVIVKDAKKRDEIYQDFLKENEKAKEIFKDKELYSKLKLEGIKESYLNIAVLYEKSDKRVLGQTSQKKMGEYSVVCAIQNFWLMARAHNIGVGWVSILKPKRVKKILNIEKNHKLIAYLTVGYVDEFLDEPELLTLDWEKKKINERYQGHIVGVKTKLFYEDIKPFFDIKSLQETKNGESHTVYILDNDYILKIYEEENLFNIDAEIELLNYTKKLCVPKVIKDDIFIKGKRGLVFSKAKGESVVEFVKSTHLEQIGQFLNSFHKMTKNKKHDNLSAFGKSQLKVMIEKTCNKAFKDEFDCLKIELKNDGIIHGDLFLDNATFCGDKLTCVFDFSDACEGDFIFDLAVVALSWCSNKEEINILLKAYDKEIKLDDFIIYLRYASLYYCVKRHLTNRDYDNIIFKNKFIDLI